MKTIVEFGTTHCSQCKYQEQLLSKAVLPEDVKYISIKLDENPFGEQLMTNLNITHTPVIIAFNKFAADMEGEELNKNIIARFDGVTTPVKIINALKA